MIETTIKIQTVMDFRRYCKWRGYYPFHIVHMPGDGFYAQVVVGEGKVEHFSNIIRKYEPRPGVKLMEYEGIPISSFEWCRLSEKDVDNQEIVGTYVEGPYL